MVTKVFAITGMHCVSCGMNIDGELEDREGVISSVTHYAKQKTEVKFDEKVIDVKEIESVIENLGYTASSQE